VVSVLVLLVVFVPKLEHALIMNDLKKRHTVELRAELGLALPGDFFRSRICTKIGRCSYH
jgi:hypothetical protein